MAQPQKPANLDPNHVYIHITSPSSPSTISDALASSGDTIKYVGPVGELSGEHIFEVQRQSAPLKRDVGGGAGIGNEVLAALKGVEGVKGAKVLEVKQRVKRGGEF